MKVLYSILQILSGKEEVCEAMDILIGEVLSVFKTTPYFHIGGDEAIFTGVDKDPDVQNI